MVAVFLLVLIIGCWINIYLLSRLVTMGHLLSVLIIVLVFFPSGAIAWRISDESFHEEFKVLTI